MSIHGEVPILAREIQKTDSFAKDVGQELHLCHPGVYQPGADQYVKKRVKQLLVGWNMTSEWTKGLADDVAAYVLADVAELWSAPPNNVINLLNGLLDVETLKLSPHTPT